MARSYPRPEQVQEIFRRLFVAYGPQQWWPADTPFEVIIGAILTQNTAWQNVEKALKRMKKSGLWSLRAILGADDRRLAEAIRPSGYFNVKARKLKELARAVRNDFGGKLDRLLSLETTALRDFLLGVWGIGEETADDIVLYAANKPAFVIDAYTRRIVDRLGWRVKGNGYGDYQALFEERLPEDAGLYNEYHALLVRHAVTTCKKKAPVCDECCLLDECSTGRKGRRKRRGA